MCPNFLCSKTDDEKPETAQRESGHLLDRYSQTLHLVFSWWVMCCSIVEGFIIKYENTDCSSEVQSIQLRNSFMLKTKKSRSYFICHLEIHGDFHCATIKVPWWWDYNLFAMWPSSQESERGPRTATASISTSPPWRQKEGDNEGIGK